MQTALTVILVCLMITACVATDPSNPGHTNDNQSMTAIDTFETTENARQLAKAQGLPILLRGIEVIYPVELEPSKTGHGWVNLRMDILPNGTAQNITVISSSNDVFEDAAIKSAKTWHFEPASMSYNDYYHRVFFKGTQADHYQPTTPLKTN